MQPTWDHDVVIAVVAVVGIAVTVAPRVLVIRELRRQGCSWSRALRPLYFIPGAWVFASLLVGLASPVVGGLMLVTVAAVCLFVLVRAGVKGVWRFPTAARLIGDPKAWRGERKPYWEAERDDSR